MRQGKATPPKGNKIQHCQDSYDAAAKLLNIAKMHMRDPRKLKELESAIKVVQSGCLELAKDVFLQRSSETLQKVMLPSQVDSMLTAMEKSKK